MQAAAGRTSSRDAGASRSPFALTMQGWKGPGREHRLPASASSQSEASWRPARSCDVGPDPETVAERRSRLWYGTNPTGVPAAAALAPRPSPSTSRLRYGRPMGAAARASASCCRRVAHLQAAQTTPSSRSRLPPKAIVHIATPDPPHNGPPHASDVLP